MKFNLKLNKLILLPIVLMFFPAFAFYLPGLNGIYLFYYIAIYLCLLVFLFNDKANFVNKILNIIKKTPLKYLALTFGLIIINSFILSIIGISSFGVSIKNIFIRLLLAIVPIILFYCYTLCRYISIKKFTKIFLFLYWLNLIIGFIAYIGQLLGIEIINNAFDFFANIRILGDKYGDLTSATLSNYEAFGMPRLDNLHQEPSHYAQFLFLFLPLTYAFSTNKIKIFKNTFLNILIKKTLIPFTWISLILTLSPIFLIFAGLITIIYFHKEFLRLLKKILIPLMIFIVVLVILLSKIDLSETYLSRIINVLTNIKSFDDFILVEQSLATRVVSYINCICIFTKNIFTGVGFGNVINVIDEQYLTSPVSLTPEIIGKNAILMKQSKGFFTSGFIYTYLAENGIVITSILILFYCKLLKCLNHLVRLYQNDLCFDTSFLRFLKYTFIALLINSFYNLSPISIYLFFVIALIVSYIYTWKFNKYKGENNEKNYIHG